MTRDVLERLVLGVMHDVLDDDGARRGEGAAAGGAAVVHRYLVERHEESVVESILGHDRERLSICTYELDVAFFRAGQRLYRAQDLIPAGLQRAASPEPGAGLAEPRERRGLRRRPVAAVAELLLGLAAIGDVARDLGRADDIPARIPDRGNRDGDRDPPAILGDADSLAVVDAPAGTDAFDDALLLVVQLWRDQRRDVPADHLFGLVAEDPRRPGVPGLHDAVERLADDRVIG
jgi:hypothetical protein